jgi:hypothetical protein
MVQFRPRLVSYFSRIALVLVILSLSGCGGGELFSGGLFGNSDSAPSQPSSAQGGINVMELRAEDVCPEIEIRLGTGVYQNYERGKENDPAALRYQASITQTARDCTPVAGQLSIQVGVSGRVLSGPKGNPGKVTVPLRIAVVKRSSGEVAYSKLYPVDVTIEPPEVSAVFTKVEPAIIIDMPKSPIETIIYVGFDGQG